MVEQENQKQNESGKPQNAEQSQSPSMFGTNGTPQSSDEQSKKKYNANNLAEQIRHTDHVIAWSAGITACLTLVLAIFTGLQAYSFIESERAYLIVDNIAFRHSEPTLDFDGLDLVITIKNVGKHMALVTTLDILPLFGTNHKELPNIPNYEGSIVNKVVPPTPPSSQTTVNVHMAGIKPLPGHERQNTSTTDTVIGVINGDIPFWVFGFINYDIGYPWFHGGVVGYCQQYVPDKLRVGSDLRFQTCSSPKYTYVR